MGAEFLTLSFIIFHITRVISSPDEEEFARLLYILESYRGGGRRCGDEARTVHLDDGVLDLDAVLLGHRGGGVAAERGPAEDAGARGREAGGRGGEPAADGEPGGV
jgi:hypothetical protein